MKTFTIGFTQKSAEQFFTKLHQHGVHTVLDIRLKHNSQLSGFAKSRDLPYLCRTLANCDYHILPELAPKADMLKAYRQGTLSWNGYEQEYNNLMIQRHITQQISAADIDGACLLCSEHQPHFCHRRLAVEYLKEAFNLDLKVVHIV